MAEHVATGPLCMECHVQRKQLPIRFLVDVILAMLRVAGVRGIRGVAQRLVSGFDLEPNRFVAI